jgi:hypothetical protein
MFRSSSLSICNRNILAQLRLLAIPGIDRALDNCRKVLDHSRKVGLPVAFIRMVAASAFFNRHAVRPRDRGF